MAGGPPAKVVINEYLDVARGFFTGAEPGMANAVLDRLARVLRPGEFASKCGFVSTVPSSRRRMGRAQRNPS